MKDDVKLFIIRGVPGAGKTTTALRMIKNNIVDEHFEADMYFYNSDGLYEFDKNKIRNSHMWCLSQVLNSLANDKRVVVANTFITKREVLAYTNICSINNIKYQLMTCSGNYQNTHGVSDDKIAFMKQRFEQF